MFNDLLGDGLDILRGEALSRMTAELIVERPLGLLDDADGNVATEFAPVYGSREAPGRGWVRLTQMLGGALLARAAGNIQVFGSATVHIPWDAPQARPGDSVTVLADPRNPALAGESFMVASVDTNSSSTAQRLQVRHPQAGGGLP